MIPPLMPPAFDPGHYRAANPDLDLPDDEAAADHYAREGREAGRIGSPLATREGLLAFIADADAALEIGPFCRPLLTGPHVAYLDVMDAAALRERAIAHGLDPAGCPERIDYVGDLDRIDRRFDLIVSSHAIEHQPDLVAHLEAVARLLEPGGLFALIVPDKRFCFDHFLPESGIAAVLQAHRERRTIHSLQSVVEHDALVTHNDAARHWRGDHGEPDAALAARRLREAMARYDRSEGDYLDVHAWQFTPESFARLVATLNALGLTRLEPLAVYDTPRDRMEFCALLQLRQPARPAHVAADGGHGLDIVMMQTADPFRYRAMLNATAPTVVEYARRHGLRYESYVGVRRGWWNWQATYNRIPMLADLLARGFAGWAVYMDADAFINDLDFDLPAYLSGHADRAAIFATSGVTGEAWDVNAGIAFVNFGHPEGRRLVELWAADFAAVPDERLKAAERWLHGDNDQDLLQAILRRDGPIAAAVHVESMDLINSRHARFIRQHLRAQTGDLDERTRAIAAEVHAIFARDGRVAFEGDGGAILDERGRHGLLHSPVAGLRLVAAPAATPRPDLASLAIKAWQANPDRPPPPSYRATFCAALDAGDGDAVAAQLAAIGREPLSEGFLGGARQHRRAETDHLFAYRRAQRSQDALLSLAEMCGAIGLENPDLGPWGENGRIPADRLVSLIAAATGASLDPPAQIGGYLGIAAGGSRVLHLRMIEAFHTAWRLRQLADTAGLARSIEVGGGAGFTAFYAARFGLVHALVDVAEMHAVQAFVLGEAARLVPVDAIGGHDLLLAEDGFHGLPEAACLDVLGRARAGGVRAILSIAHEADGERGIAHRPIRAMLAELGGYRLASRQRHALRPGHVEELYLRP